MGLDMYLTARMYLSEYSEDKKPIRNKISNMFENIDFEVEEVIFDVGQWRKANAIHKWFVDNVQEGNDDCKSYHVTEEQLKELLDICKEVLNNKEKAEELLPTESGFFFGGTEYDEYYFEDIKYTITIIEKALKHNKLDYYYNSSW